MAKVKHVVLLKFKDGTSEDRTNKYFDDLLDLSESISGIDDYVSGNNNSSEERSQGLTHGFIMTFADASARDAYVAHPDHEKFKASVADIVDNAIVFDFEV